MTLTQEDITKIKEIEKQPLITCLNYLSMIKDRNEEQKKELRKLKSKNAWNRT